MRRLAWFALALAVIAATFVLGTKLARRDTIVAGSADGSRVARAEDRRCWSGPCQALWIGVRGGDATRVATLEGTGRCREIVWTRDGSRVAFLIDAGQLRFFDPASLAPAGQISLLPEQAGGRAVVRGITFSDNGRAITYDECPLGRSGCRSGIAAVPR